MPEYILHFSGLDLEDSTETGSKAATLAEMSQAGFPVPPGFVVSARAFKEFIEQNSLKKPVQDILSAANLESPQELQSVYQEIKKLFAKSSLSKEIKKEIVNSYDEMGSLFRKPLVAVRSSPIVHGSLKSSFAGQQETLLNISGESSLLEAVRHCWSSVYNPRALAFLDGKRQDFLDFSAAVIVQQMVQSEVSGVAFTSDPASGDKHQMVIEAIWGLGELAVHGKIVPDIYKIERHSLEIVSIETNPQTYELIKSGLTNKEVRVSAKRSGKQKLSGSEIKELAKLLQKVHAHYFFPQDIEWAKVKNKFYLLHVRPLTGISRLPDISENAEIHKEQLKGQAASPGIVTGVAKVVGSVRDLGKLRKGEILVTEHISPDFIPVMKFTAGIITEKGGMTSHAAIIARELGIPCIVGVPRATQIIKSGEVVTLNAAQGIIYKGGAAKKSSFRAEEVKSRPSNAKNSILEAKTATKIYLSLAEPEKASEAARLPADGIGLLRAEFMISAIGVHPRHMLAQGRQKIFVESLAQNVEKFCASFAPRPVMYRTSDFKTSEYRHLQGGKPFEPEEENPMLGFRGALRYISDPEVFELELAAVKKVREKYKNLSVMLPYVRSPQELLHVKRIMAAAGLLRGINFKLWMMIELPVNVILIEDFLKVGIDGVSFGSNDLTMLLLGTDRDNNEVSSAYDELDPAVFWSIERVCRACKKYKVETSICGQAASVYDTLVERLVELGIGSISVAPDAFGRVKRVVYETERKLIKQ